MVVLSLMPKAWRGWAVVMVLRNHGGMFLAMKKTRSQAQKYIASLPPCLRNRCRGVQRSIVGCAQ
jgi:hypothetical protein